MMRPCGLIAVGMSFCVLVASTGCGPGGNPNVAPVTGTVTLDGQPFADAVVMFNPTGTEGSTSSARTDSSGAYELVYSADQKGAWIGSHSVEKFKAEEETEVSEEGEGEEEEFEDREDAAPVFEETADVKSGPNVIDFALESGGAAPDASE